MKTVAELQLRKIALLLTVILALQVLWSGAKLLFMSETEAILPAAAALQVNGVMDSQIVGEEQLALGLASKPLFWQGREVYVPPVAVEEDEVVEALPRNADIDAAELLGIYAGGANPGVIVAQGGERLRLNVNESLAGWELIHITPYTALFENGGESKLLTLTHVTPDPRAAKKASVRRNGAQRNGKGSQQRAKQGKNTKNKKERKDKSFSKRTF